MIHRGGDSGLAEQPKAGRKDHAVAPETIERIKDVVGLYLNPPENAIALSVDEKTSIWALERSQLPLPLR